MLLYHRHTATKSNIEIVKFKTANVKREKDKGGPTNVVSKLCRKRREYNQTEGEREKEIL